MYITLCIQNELTVLKYLTSFLDVLYIGDTVILLFLHSMYYIIIFIIMF
jgi:hypothetical protein